MSHNLSHSHEQVLGFQIYPLSYTNLLIKSSLHSHLHLSSFHIYLLLQITEVTLHMHLQVSCHTICLVSLIRAIRLNTLTLIFLAMSGAHNLANGSLIVLQDPLHLLTLIEYG